MKDISRITRKVFIMVSFSVFAASLPFHTTNAAPGAGGVVEPAVSIGVTILPLEQHPVPDMLKTQAKLEFTQMKKRGYIDATEDAVSYLDRAKENKKKRLKAMVDISSKLKITPASLDASSLKQATLLGASASGGYTEEGWTGLNRIFIVPNLGIVGLKELDFLASQGGMVFIEEAINQEVNGRPAILSVKQSRSKKGLSELTWATDRKIFTLSTNRALKTQKSIDQFVDIARNIF